MIPNAATPNSVAINSGVSASGGGDEPVLQVVQSCSYGDVLVVAQSCRYGLEAEFQVAQVCAYGDLPEIQVSQSCAYGDLSDLRAVQVCTYSDLPEIQVVQSCAYSDLPEIQVPQSCTYGDLPDLRAVQACAYGDLPEIQVAQVCTYELMAPLQVVHTCAYGSLDEAPLSLTQTAHYSLGEPLGNLILPVSILARGREIDCTDVEISQDEGGYWVVTLTNVEASDLRYFPLHSEFSVWLDDVEFRFLVDHSSRQAGDGPPTTSIHGLSVASVYDSPQAELVTRTWGETAMASAISAEMLGGVTWSMVDWPIKPTRLAVENAPPISIARQIVEAAGGVIQIEPNGSFIARPEFPIRPTHYFSVQPDFELSEYRDVFTVSVEASFSEIVDSVRVYDTQADVFQDWIDFDLDDIDPLKGVAHVYPSPWRQSFELITSAGVRVSVQRIGEAGREVGAEQVEFRDGIASTQYPVAGVLSVAWITDDLGPVTHESYGSALQVADLGYGLAEVSYLTRSIDYQAVASQATAAQLLVRDLGD